MGKRHKVTRVRNREALKQFREELKTGQRRKQVSHWLPLVDYY